MGPTRAAALMIILALGAGACSSQPSQQTLTDTTGASFEFCDSAGCDISSSATIPASCNDWTMFDSRIPVMCSSRSANGISADAETECRPFKCASDSDCPQVEGWSLVCQSTACQALGFPLTFDDVLALCVAGIQRSAACEFIPPFSDPTVQAAYDPRRGSR